MSHKRVLLLKSSLRTTHGLQYFPTTGEKTEAHRGPCHTTMSTAQSRLKLTPKAAAPRAPCQLPHPCDSQASQRPAATGRRLLLWPVLQPFPGDLRLSAGITGLTLALKFLRCEQAQETLGREV